MAVESFLRQGHNHSPRGFIRMDKYGSNNVMVALVASCCSKNTKEVSPLLRTRTVKERVNRLGKRQELIRVNCS